MDRQTALDSTLENVANQNLVKHMLAVEAVMRALARRFGGDEDEWGLAGLLHDIDVEQTEGDMHAHSRLGADLARDLGAGEAIANAILVHNATHGIAPQTDMEKALYCADPLTGLITASALVMPDRKLASLQLKSVMKRFKAKGFAAGASREQIAACSELGLELDDFVEMGLEAMKSVAPQLGL